MRAQIGTSSYERAKGGLPELPVVNMFIEAAPTEETGYALQSRPPLHDRLANMGTGTVEGLFQRDGVLGGALFGVAGGSLYEGETLIGPLDGTGPVSMAGNETGLMVTLGTSLWFYDGATLSAVEFPDEASVSKVFSGGGRFWALRADSGKIYWTSALGSTFNALNFATAESLPDRLLDGLWIDDTAALFGAASVEFWPNTQDDDLPIQPLEARVFERGIRGTGCAVVFGATFAWVGDDNAVYVNGQEPTPISSVGLNAKIAESVTCRLFTFEYEGIEYLVLRLDDETHCFNGRWSRLETAGGNWAARCHAGGVFGGLNGKTYAFGSDYIELGGTLERRFRGGFAINSGGLTIDNLLIRGNVGQTPYLTGDYANPVVEMRLSRDGGLTWGGWKQKRLGTQGEYRKGVQWRGLGQASRPGFLFEVRVTDPVDYRANDALINEPYGGR